MRTPNSPSCVLGCLLACACWCSAAWAALGQAPLPGARQVADSPAYSVRVTDLPSGTVVREYTNMAGRVFAVSWEGPLLPDLAVLLGEHASEYTQAVQQQRAMGQRGGPVQTQNAHVVIVSRGRMGQFKGHAYLPPAVPAGLSIGTLLP